jgi:hypothetical protein
MNTIDRALELAAQGIACFPCSSTKAPTKPKECGGQGYKDATSDPAALRKFWSEFPGDLIGVPTGELNGFDVLDIDPKHQSAREWWLENRDDLIPTRAHRTRSGGLHLLYKSTPGIKCSAGKITIGVDIRANGGYVIHWPSAGFPVLNDGPIAELPTWLYRKLLLPPRIHPVTARALYHEDERAVYGLLRVVATAVPGEQNNKIFWAACRFREMAEAGGITQEEALDLIMAAARRCGHPEKRASATAKGGLGLPRR